MHHAFKGAIGLNQIMQIKLIDIEMERYELVQQY